MPATVYPLSSKEYASRNGDHCPHCGSKHTHSLGPVDVGCDGMGYQHIACQKCHRKWYDRYKLVGFVPSK